MTEKLKLALIFRMESGSSQINALTKNVDLDFSLLTNSQLRPHFIKELDYKRLRMTSRT